MALKSLFRESASTITETVKAIVSGPSVAEAEAKWTLAQEDVDRALATYDEEPNVVNREALQKARASLQDATEDLESARRRELRHAANVKAAQIRAELKRKSEIVTDLRDAVAFFDQALSNLTPAVKRVMAAVARAHSLGDRDLTEAAIAVVQAIPWVVNAKLAVVGTVKQSGVPPEVVESLAYHLKALPVIDEA